jgi:integrase
MARGKKPARKIRLTELNVRKAPPKATTYQVWDALQRGLALRVQPTGHKSWMTVYSRQGRGRWLTLGNADAIALADARRLAAEVMVEVARGKDPAAERKTQRGAGSFDELADAYVELYAKKHNRSWQQAARLVARFARPRWGKLQAASIVRADVKALMASIEAPIVANQALAALSAIFTWAIKEERLTTNPCRLIDRNDTKKRERVLAESELAAFWAAFDEAGLTGQALKALLLLGQRPGEVAHMRGEHIIDGWWELPGAPVPTLGWPGTKNSCDHRVWIPKPALALINGCKSGFVFGGVVDLSAAMRDICKQLGAARATPHDLRRTHGTMITGAGFGRPAMNRIENHKEGGIGSVYDRHEYADENRKIMEAVAAKIIGIVEGKADPGNILPFAARAGAEAH